MDHHTVHHTFVTVAGTEIDMIDVDSIYVLWCAQLYPIPDVACETSGNHPRSQQNESIRQQNGACTVIRASACADVTGRQFPAW